MAIIALCVALYAVSALVPGAREWLLIHGAQQQELVLAGDTWRLLTATLLHASLMHLLFNMWALYVLGAELERRVGALPFAALYVAAGIGGGALYQLIGGAAPVVGASGAIFGLFGCWLVAGWKARGTPGGRAGLRQMVLLLVINLALPLFIPGIAWQAHLGGFAVGLVVASVWVTRVGRSPRVRAAVAAAIGVLAFAAVAGLG
jgi:membrane associated rhomboid family serine protease